MTKANKIATVAAAATVAAMVGAFSDNAQAGGTSCSNGCGGDTGGHSHPTKPNQPPIYNQGGQGGKGGTGIGIGIGQGGQGGQGGKGGNGYGGNATANGGDANANSNANASANNGGVNVVSKYKAAAYAPSVVVSPSGECGSGFGVSFGVLAATGGASYSWQDSHCLSIKTSQYMIETGIIHGKNDVMVMGLSMIQKLDKAADYAGAHVARVEMMGECGRRAMAVSPVLASRPEFQCSGTFKGAVERTHAPKLVRHHEVKAANVNDCLAAKKKAENICHAIK